MADVPLHYRLRSNTHTLNKGDVPPEFLLDLIRRAESRERTDDKQYRKKNRKKRYGNCSAVHPAYSSLVIEVPGGPSGSLFVVKIYRLDTDADALECLDVDPQRRISFKSTEPYQIDRGEAYRYMVRRTENEMFNTVRAREILGRDPRVTVPKVFAWGTCKARNQTFICMEYMDFPFTLQTLSESEACDPTTLKEIITSVKRAERTLRNNGVEHNDIKTFSNVKATADGTRIAIIDFGEARPTERNKRTHTQVKTWPTCQTKRRRTPGLRRTSAF